MSATSKMDWPGWRRFAAYLILAAVVFAADQFTKHLAQVALAGGATVEVMPFLRFALVFNRGAAFGILAGAGGWQTVFLSAIAGVLSLALVAWLWLIQRQPQQNTLLSCALALLLAGAVGNLSDRAAYAHVVDFIVLYYGAWQFPAFNLADSAITVGAAALIADHFGAGRTGRRRV